MGNNLFGKFHCLGIAAPASGCVPEKLQSGLTFLEQHGIKVIPGKNLFARGTFSYLSADDGKISTLWQRIRKWMRSFVSEAAMEHQESLKKSIMIFYAGGNCR